MEIDLRAGDSVVSHEASKKSKKKRKREKEKVNDDEDDVVGVHVESEPQPMNVSSKDRLSVDAKVEVIFERTNKAPPIVGYFPSGYNPHKYNNHSGLQEGGEEPSSASPRVRFYRRKSEKGSNERSEKGRGSERLELVVSPNESNVEFVGTSYKGEAMAAQLCTYALGVLDKETQTLKIMPIAGNKIFRLEPRIPGLDTADKEQSNLNNAEISAQSVEDKRISLNRLYGTKKSKRQDEIGKALYQKQDDKSKEDEGKILANAPVNKEALESTSAVVARNIPPHNTSATTPQGAYPLDRIIFIGEWNFIEDIYQTLEAGAEVARDVYPTFVCNRIHKLREIQDDMEKRTLAGIFSYITHLIKFKDLHSMNGVSSAKNHRFPSSLRQKFFEIFSPESKRMSDEKVDLLISYVLVLTLYADDFRTDPLDIAKDLRVSPVMLRAHFENLGCKLVHENKLLLATLPVPLQFPKLRQKRRR